MPQARAFGRHLATGSAAAAAMYLAPGMVGSADAAIVHVTTPIQIGIGGGSVPWDIDGDTVADFTLSTFGLTSASINGGGAFVNLVGSNEDGIEGFPTQESQFDIGPNLAPPYFFGVTNAVFRTMMTSGGAFLGPDALGWDAPTQYVAYRFNSGGFKYGWASVTLDTTAAVIRINEWAYENTGGAIHMGTVPEPSTAAITGLALLACGAGGVRRWQRDRATRN